MCLQLLELDRELGDFLAVLDSRGIDYAVALTADHGGQDIPERAAPERASPTRRASIPRLAPGRDGQGAGRQQLGLAGPGLLGSATSAATSTSTDHLRPRDRHAAAECRGRRLSRPHPQVAAVFTADADRATLRCRQAIPVSWTLIQRARAQLRSRPVGRLRRVPQDATSRRSPTPTRLCRNPRQPLGLRPPRADPVLAARACAGATVERSVETVDIMPTLAAMIGLAVAAGLDRRPLPAERVPASVVRRTKHLKTRAFLSSIIQA